jgi:LmbE family N-acetylglucosaminyl deacetylase
MTRRLAAVFAHPDDDTYSVAGSMALHAGEDVRAIVVLATSGEAGQIVDPSLATPDSLGRVREREDVESWREVGVPVEHHFLGFADGGVDAVPSETLAERIAEVLLATRPHVVATFGPEGITGHADHIAVGRAATEAFHRLRPNGAEEGGGFERLLYGSIPQSTMDRLAVEYLERGLEPLDPTQPFQPRGVPDERFGMSVDCSSVYGRKLEALRRHRTQGEMQDVPFDLWPEVLGREDFVVAWPERRAGEAKLRDLFEDIAG